VALGKLPCYGEPDPYLAHLVDRDPPALSEARMEDLRGLARAGVTPEEILARLSPDELARLPY
jgi:hypothetical protein